MQKWARWQDWVTLIAGAYAALSPIWTTTDRTATWTMVVLGVVTVVASLWALAMPEDRISEYGLMLLGVLFIISPWVMGFTNLTSMAVTAWIVGAVTLVAGFLAVPQVDGRMHHTRVAH
ncbi:SPW repeat protein [Cumulibacter manganitolerans]|uniref:SPW repeat protein n=1 Tax=Cumulibacter manganitolerans TaxID=1884992 RepID=UPI001295DA57|nr:SPW repeat protein [Cumulibacter manganitolerans]